MLPKCHVVAVRFGKKAEALALQVLIFGGGAGWRDVVSQSFHVLDGKLERRQSRKQFGRAGE